MCVYTFFHFKHLGPTLLWIEVKSDTFSTFEPFWWAILQVDMYIWYLYFSFPCGLNLFYLLTCTQCDAFYVGKTKTSLSTRMIDNRSSSNNPDILPLPVAIHTKSHQLLFNSCWNVHVLHNLPPNTNHIACQPRWSRGNMLPSRSRVHRFKPS